MNTSEAGKVLYTLKAAFPNSYKNMENGLSKSIVELWAASFDDTPFQKVYDAVLGWISTEDHGFPPSIGQVKNMLAKLNGPRELTEGEAWGTVRKALKNSLYSSIDEFNALPEVVRYAVGSPEMLKSWAQVPLDELETVIQSNFMRTFRAKSTNLKEIKLLPQAVREKMDQVMIEGMEKAEGQKFEVLPIPRGNINHPQTIDCICDYVKQKAGVDYE